MSSLSLLMISKFYNAAAGCKLHSAAVIPYASAGDFARFNPLHAIVLEGGFDLSGRFVHIPQIDLVRLCQYFRASMVTFFLKRELINQRLARNMLQWDHLRFQRRSCASPQALPEPARGCPSTSPGHRFP